MTDSMLVSDEEFLANFDKIREEILPDGEGAQSANSNDGSTEGEAQTSLDGEGQQQEDQDKGTEGATGEADGSASAEPNGESDAGKAKEAGAAEPDANKVGAAATAETQEQAPNYEELYKQITGPFKANGRQFEIKSPDEAIKLMQLGANYGKKMQELQPTRKAAAMLEQAGLLKDTEQLSFLIDLHKKNPEAIKKLLKDTDTNVFDLDLDKEINYVGGRNTVSDTELNFRSTVEDVMSSDGGRELIAVIDTKWDEDSKTALWKNPSILTSLQEARQSGSFAIIDDEIERRRTLGLVPANTPYLELYTQVGNDLSARLDTGRQLGNGNPAGHIDPATLAGQPRVVEPIATRAAVPKTDTSNSEQALAAATTRQNTPTPKVAVNPLNMDDAEFMKQFGIR